MPSQHLADFRRSVRTHALAVSVTEETQKCVYPDSNSDLRYLGRWPHHFNHWGAVARVILQRIYNCRHFGQRAQFITVKTNVLSKALEAGTACSP